MSDSLPTAPRPCRKQAPYLHRLVDDELPTTLEEPLLQHLHDCKCCHDYLALLEVEDHALHDLRARQDEDLDALWSDFLEEKIHHQLAEELDEALTALGECDETGRPAAEALLQRRVAHSRRWLGGRGEPLGAGGRSVRGVDTNDAVGGL